MSLKYEPVSVTTTLHQVKRSVAMMLQKWSEKWGHLTKVNPKCRGARRLESLNLEPWTLSLVPKPGP